MTRPSAGAVRHLYRQEFPFFMRRSFATLEQGRPFVPTWHSSALAHQLERVRRGECTRLIINLPPRELKSMTVSVAWPAYLLGLDPTRRIICASYGQELSHKLSNDFRILVSSDWYRETFPDTRIGRFKDSQAEVQFSRGGFRMATSVGGALIGRGGSILIVDDPLKPNEAISKAKLEAVNEWYSNTLLSRLDDPSTGAIVIVMQRVHMDDLTSYVQRNGSPWEVLSLPAIAVCDQDIPLYDGSIHHRRTGDLLSPLRLSLETLQHHQQEMGPDVFSAQYQQAPVPPGGAMVKRDWVQRYSELPPLYEQLCVVQSWDTANKGGPDNDYSVCTTWIQTRDSRFYLIDTWRARVGYSDLRDRVQLLAAHHRASLVLVEDCGTATGLLDDLKYVVPGLTGVKPDRDKQARMSIASARFRAGQIFFPTSAPWLADVEAELFSFPAGSHDDCVDSISQAILNGIDTEYAMWAKLGERSNGHTYAGR